MKKHTLVNRQTLSKIKLRFIGIVCLLLCFKSYAQPGTLDSSFGVNGKTTLNEVFGRANALLPNGKIAVVGFYNESFLLLYNSDGSLDENFGDNGINIIDIYATHQFYISDAYDVAAQPDNKILVTGNGYYKDGHGSYRVDAFILRYNTDGSLDESFGDRGAVISDYGNTGDVAKKIVLRADGNILIGGTSSSAYYFVAMYHANGSFDSSFAGVGWVRSGNGSPHLSSLALQSDNKIVISYNDDAIGYLLRFKTNGTTDSSFGINGIVSTGIDARDELYDLVVQPDGKILATGGGWRDNFKKQVLVLRRYDEDGNLDTSFDNDGIVNTVSDTAWIYSNAVVLQPDKQIIVGGYMGNPYSSSYSTIISARYNKEGTMNANYGAYGIQLTGEGEIKDLALQPDGKIVALCRDLLGNLLLIRLKGEHQTDPEFAKIKKWLHKHGFTWDDFPHLTPGGSIHVERSNNGNIFTTIASIMPHNNNQPNSFEDPAPLAGTNYYRLTATTANGDNISSNVIAIEPDNTASVKVYPNPVKDQLQVYGLSTAAKTTLTITDISGNRILAAIITGTSYDWNVSRLKAGSYILKIVSGNTVITKMFVKQ